MQIGVGPLRCNCHCVRGVTDCLQEGSLSCAVSSFLTSCWVGIGTVSHYLFLALCQDNIWLHVASPAQVDRALADLVLSLLRVDPAQRLAACDALVHPFFDAISPMRTLMQVPYPPCPPIALHNCTL